MSSIEDMIDAVAGNDNVAASDAFQAVMQNKIADALDAKRVEVAASMVAPKEEPQEEE